MLPIISSCGVFVRLIFGVFVIVFGVFVRVVVGLWDVTGLNIRTGKVDSTGSCSNTGTVRVVVVFRSDINDRTGIPVLAQ